MFDDVDDTDMKKWVETKQKKTRDVTNKMEKCFAEDVPESVDATQWL